MYTEYYEITDGTFTQRFFEFAASQMLARQLGKDGVPYNWTKYGSFKDPRPIDFRGGSLVSRYIIGNLNGIYGHQRLS